VWEYRSSSRRIAADDRFALLVLVLVRCWEPTSFSGKLCGMIEVHALELSRFISPVEDFVFGRYRKICRPHGPHRSGKTTILEALCGLRHLNAGTIRLCGFDVTNSLPAERGVGYVPQDRAFSTP